MIVSVSRRTDIPAFYGEWFCNRLEEGYAMTRNPLRPSQVKRVELTPEAVDCFVFWTKNPAPMLDWLDRLEGYAYYIQFTLNAYGREIEPGLPPLEERLETFSTLAARIGNMRMVWRYDPILYYGEVGLEFHLERFKQIAQRLEGLTGRCVISFVDNYRSVNRAFERLGIAEVPHGDRRLLAQGLSEIGRSHGLALYACCEDEDYTPFGVLPGACVDAGMIASLKGSGTVFRRDPHQRKGCGCAASVDIGAYNTCPHGCVYCYANHSPAKAMAAIANHDVNSPFLL